MSVCVCVCVCAHARVCAVLSGLALLIIVLWLTVSTAH